MPSHTAFRPGITQPLRPGMWVSHNAYRRPRTEAYGGSLGRIKLPHNGTWRRKQPSHHLASTATKDWPSLSNGLRHLAWPARYVTPARQWLNGYVEAREPGPGPRPRPQPTVQLRNARGGPKSGPRGPRTHCSETGRPGGKGYGTRRLGGDVGTDRKSVV